MAIDGYSVYKPFKRVKKKKKKENYLQAQDLFAENTLLL